jgi:hypothetical protein
VLLGDASGARLQMEVPLSQAHSDIRVRARACTRAAAFLSFMLTRACATPPLTPQPGDEAELVVVSDEPALQRFSAVREAYFPELGLWLSEYPFLERRTFRAVSDAVAAERERAAA